MFTAYLEKATAPSRKILEAETMKELQHHANVYWEENKADLRATVTCIRFYEDGKLLGQWGSH